MKTPMQQISDKFIHSSQEEFYAWLWVHRIELVIQEEEIISETYDKGYSKGLIIGKQKNLYDDIKTRSN